MLFIPQLSLPFMEALLPYSTDKKTRSLHFPAAACSWEFSDLTEPAPAVSGGKYYIPIKASGPTNVNILYTHLSPLKDAVDRLGDG